MYYGPRWPLSAANTTVTESHDRTRAGPDVPQIPPSGGCPGLKSYWAGTSSSQVDLVMRHAGCVLLEDRRHSRQGPMGTPARMPRSSSMLSLECVLGFDQRASYGIVVQACRGLVHSLYCPTEQWAGRSRRLAFNKL